MDRQDTGVETVANSELLAMAAEMESQSGVEGQTVRTEVFVGANGERIWSRDHRDGVAPGGTSRRHQATLELTVALLAEALEQAQNELASATNGRG